MYLKVDCNLDFTAIGLKLAPDASPDSFGHDYENVYEWMYVDMHDVSFSLNVSREHGWAEIDDELLDFESTATREELQALVKSGPVYIFGWDRGNNHYVDHLPDWLAQQIANRLDADVLVYDRRMDVEIPDGDPIAVVKPHAEKRK